MESEGNNEHSCILTQAEQDLVAVQLVTAQQIPTHLLKGI